MNNACWAFRFQGHTQFVSDFFTPAQKHKSSESEKKYTAVFNNLVFYSCNISASNVQISKHITDVEARREGGTNKGEKGNRNIILNNTE